VLPACFAIILYGIASIHTAFLPIKNSYLISFVQACGIFCIFFKLDRALAHGPAIRFLAASSFAVYLVHGVIDHRSSRLCRPSGAQDQPSWRPPGSHGDLRRLRPPDAQETLAGRRLSSRRATAP
jgi:peptidoglycan/LPS O-acetylase OafA/YrhL